MNSPNILRDYQPGTNPGPKWSINFLLRWDQVSFLAYRNILDINLSTYFHSLINSDIKGYEYANNHKSYLIYKIYKKFCPDLNRHAFFCIEDWIF